MFVIHSRNLLRKIKLKENIRTITLSGYFRDESEDPKTKAAKKLNLLLQSIINDDSIVKEDETVKKFATDKTKFKKRKIIKQEKPKNLGEKIVEAAKEVAENIKGEPEVTEAELLHKLLYKDENLQKSVLNASKNKTLSELLTEMNVEKSPKTGKGKSIKDDQYSRAGHVRSLLKDGEVRTRYSFSEAHEVKLDLFGGRPLGIFTDQADSSVDDEFKLKTWEHCHSREIRLSITHPPTNIYEQMIIWTNRGMLWKFPIDNEQGMDEEKKVSFADHVFLENYLEDWCPERGPIRHFMELVCVGLSRNYWLTAKEKKDHILWYKEYFSQKNELIKELGAGEISLPSSTVQSSHAN